MYFSNLGISKRKKSQTANPALTARKEKIKYGSGIYLNALFSFGRLLYFRCTVKQPACDSNLLQELKNLPQLK